MKELSLTAAVIAYNASDCICFCLDALLSTGLNAKDILVVDDGSTDDTRAIVCAGYPEIKVVELDENLGHSLSCNLAIKEAKTEWVVIMDHDTEVSSSWLPELKKAITLHPDAGIINSRATFFHDKTTIHCDGGYAHYIGSMSLLHGYTKLENASNENCELGAAATISMAINRQKALDVGLFDEDFFVYLNDFEFSLRIRLAGYKIFTAIESIIFHKGGTPELSYRGGKTYPKFRAYLILRNRWLLILKLYRLRTIIVCSPMLLIYEAILLLMAFKRGVYSEYVNAAKWIIQNWSLIKSKRVETKKIRKIKDCQLLSARELTFVPGLINSRVTKSTKSLVESLFAFYWRAFSRFL